VTWPASADEIGAHRDIKSYSVYRRVIGSASWGTPIYTTPSAGTPTYDWEDRAVPIGQSYQYGVVARDCTPALSAMTSAPGSATPSP
jgi:hypothetical protein